MKKKQEWIEVGRVNYKSILDLDLKKEKKISKKDQVDLEDYLDPNLFHPIPVRLLISRNFRFPIKIENYKQTGKLWNPYPISIKR